MSEKYIIEFLLYIIPGFLSIELYRYFYPGKALAKFNFVAWSLIYGIFIFSFVKYIDENCFNFYLNSSKEGFPDFKFISAIIVGGLVFGISKIIIHDLLFSISNKHENLRYLAPDPLSIWAKINQKNNDNWAVVFLNDGSIYMGYIGEYKFDPNSENQDFLLKDAKRIDDNLEEQYSVNGIGVYINTKDISRIEFIK